MQLDNFAKPVIQLPQGAVRSKADFVPADLRALVQQELSLTPREEEARQLDSLVKNTFVHFDEREHPERRERRSKTWNSRDSSTKHLAPPEMEEGPGPSEVSTAESPSASPTSPTIPDYLIGFETPTAMPPCYWTPRQLQKLAPQAQALAQQAQQQAYWQQAWAAQAMQAQAQALQCQQMQYAPQQCFFPSPPSACSTAASTPVPSPPVSPAPSVNGDEPKKKNRKNVPQARDHEVTVMLRGIPTQYTPQEVRDYLHQARYRQALDFLYVPIDFKNQCNLGYAFLNFSNKDVGARFCSECERLFPGAEKPAYVQPARVQGLAANVKRFRNSSVMGVLSEEYKPMLFDGGVQKPFPGPSKKLPPVGPRFRPTHE